jgi:hypothetical protein
VTIEIDGLVDPNGLSVIIGDSKASAGKSNSRKAAAGASADSGADESGDEDEDDDHE